jgi:hypothetical protein
LFWLCLCGPVVEPTFGNALGLRRMVLEAFIVCSLAVLREFGWVVGGVVERK